MHAASVTGAILAGGPNTGMSGEPKAHLRIGNETLVQRQIRTMREVCKEIIVVTNTPKLFFDLLDPSVRLITDYFPGRGPVSGMHAALHLARHPLVWMAGCDMPFLSSDVANRLIASRMENVDALIPIVRNRPVPLHGIYDKHCAELAAKLLSGRVTSLDSFLGQIHWLGVHADAWSQSGGIGPFDYVIHDNADYEKAQELWMSKQTTLNS